MEVLKKNKFSVACGVIALLAIIAVFVYPLDGFYEDLKTRADASAAKYNRIAALESKKRLIPNPDPDNPNANYLKKFPSKTDLTSAKTALEKVRKSSVGLYSKAVALNKANHEPVMGGVLPNYSSPQFAIAFPAGLDKELKNLREVELKASIPPTPEEINNERQNLWKNVWEKRIIFLEGQPQNLPAVQAQFELEAAKVPDRLRVQRAATYRMYADPAHVLKVPRYLPTNQTIPDLRDIWWANVEYWVTRDVVDAIKDVNGDSASIPQSPIKNLVGLNVPPSFFPAVVAAGGRNDTTGAEESPASNEINPTMELPDGSSQTPTRRISNGLFDVLHFNVVLDIEADKIPAFLKTLATNRLITVLEMELIPVDSVAMQALGYVYGPKPVARISLKCEALFLREWTQFDMPEVIRTMLKVPEPKLPGGKSGK